MDFFFPTFILLIVVVVVQYIFSFTHFNYHESYFSHLKNICVSLFHQVLINSVSAENQNCKIFGFYLLVRFALPMVALRHRAQNKGRVPLLWNVNQHGAASDLTSCRIALLSLANMLDNNIAELGSAWAENEAELLLCVSFGFIYPEYSAL